MEGGAEGGGGVQPKHHGAKKRDPLGVTSSQSVGWWLSLVAHPAEVTLL